MTPRCEERMRNEIKDLLYTQRPQVVNTVSWAAGNGDRSENGDYIYGKKRLREIDRRVRFLTKRLESAEVIDPTKVVSDKVLFGATVVVENESGEEKTFSIVGLDETEPALGKISYRSPMGSALLQKKIDDVAYVKTPKGIEEYLIVDIRYEKID